MDLELVQLPALERYKPLIGVVIPRPIAWVSTISEEPPLCILSFNGAPTAR